MYSTRQLSVPQALLVLFLCTIPLIGWIGVRAYESIQIDINCTGHLKRAADSNTIPLALKELEIAVDYLDRTNTNHGSTHLIFPTPDLDIAFWYANLTESVKELKKVKSDAPQLEQTNVLMKLRETLLDGGEKGVNVTCPDGISVWPHNWLFAIWCFIGSILCVIGIIVFISTLP